MESETLVDDSKPFEGLVISDSWTKLNELDGRSVCSTCTKSRKYFCYTCYTPVPEISDLVPRLKLPCKVDIIKHKKEIDGKSTAIHAAVICNDDVNVYTYPLIPCYDTEKAVLVFPSETATSVEESFNRLKDTNDAFPFTKVIFIDSTWNQCLGIYKDPRIRGLPCVVLRKRITQFWRHQNGSPRWYLSTIEAIHQFFVEYHLCLQKSRIHSSNESSSSLDLTKRQLYKGEYDNLLFFFRFMYEKIHTLYDHDSLLSYKRPLK